MNSVLLFTILTLTFGAIIVAGELCPGHKVRCQSTQTCCLLNQGGFACCPYPLATCCSDGLHCCPHQTTCDTEHGRCLSVHPILTKLQVSSSSSSDWNQGVATNVDVDVDVEQNNNIDDQGNENPMQMQMQLVDNGNTKCPDGIQSCPETYTCCSLATGGYGCCPMTEGICCADQIHCCPKGSRCNVEEGSCDV